jgi:hypothetical protein
MSTKTITITLRICDLCKAEADPEDKMGLIIDWLVIRIENNHTTSIRRIDVCGLCANSPFRLNALLTKGALE